MKFVHSVLWRKNNTPVFSVRQLNHFLSSYPEDNFISENFAYVIYDDKPILITKIKDFEEYNDLTWLQKEEIRVLGAISLSADSIGSFSFFSENRPNYIEVDNIDEFDLCNPICINNILSFSKDSLKTLADNYGDEVIRGGGIKNPEYICQPEILYTSIDFSNDTLIKSLGYWLKAGMLSKYICFSEEATSLLFFSLEGILKLFLEELQRINPNAGIRDVPRYLMEKFNTHEGYESYIFMCYDLRIGYVHPHKSGWSSDFEPDDLLETFNVLKDLFFIYLTKNPSIAM